MRDVECVPNGFRYTCERGAGPTLRAELTSVAIRVDAGHDFTELRGVELRGRIESVGEVLRTDASDSELEEPERLCARKYTGEDVMRSSRLAACVPAKIVSWDFRKISPSHGR